MENETSKSQLAEALNKHNVSSSATLRDFYAAEILKALLAAQSHRRMTPLSRLKWWLGGKGWCNTWKADYDYNFKNAAEKAFECADIILEAR